MFAAAGLIEIGRPSIRRAVLRIDFENVPPRQPRRQPAPT
jgi:hypothetical protein